jgi:Flp pilus assembly pilin Flp
MIKTRDFITDESGAVTADWVMLTASVVVLVVTAISSLDRMTVRLAERISVAVTSGDTTSIANYDN